VPGSTTPATSSPALSGSPWRAVWAARRCGPVIIRGDLVWTARQLRGTPYGWLQYPYIGLAARGHHWRLLKSLIGNKRVIGSQLVDLIYLNNGMRLFDDGRWPGQVTPGDLHAYARGATR
jgi:hypothetical protein